MFSLAAFPRSHKTSGRKFHQFIIFPIERYYFREGDFMKLQRNVYPE